jgi:F0F1-type ATP synthase assembly protein I
MKKPQSIIEKSNTLLMTILFAAMCFAIYGGVMIYRTVVPFLKHESSMTINDGYSERTEIIEKVYLENLYKSNTIKGYEIEQNIIFINDFYNDKQQIYGKKFNLQGNPKAKYSLLFFMGYYTIMTIAWIALFIHLHMFTVTQDDYLTFYKKNSKRLFLSARIIGGIAIFKFFGIGIISIIIGKMLDEYIQITSYSYEFFTGFILLVLVAGLLKVIASAYKKAHQIEQEQELTV